MPTATGNSGSITIDANTVIELRSWTFEENAEQIDDTVMGDTAKTSKSGLATASGTIEAFYDETNADQEALAAGVSGALILYPKGTATGMPRISLQVQISGRSQSGAIDEILPVTFNYAMESGDVTRDTVP